MDMMTPQEFMDHITDFVKAVFADKGEVASMFVVVLRDGHHEPFMMPWYGEVHKQVVLPALRHLFREQGVVMYAHMCEAWMFTAKPDARGVTDMSVPASRHPERMECVQIAIAHKDGTKLSDVWVIDRTGPKAVLRPMSEVEPDMPKPDQHAGRMLELLDDPDAAKFTRPAKGERRH